MKFDVIITFLFIFSFAFSGCGRYDQKAQDICELDGYYPLKLIATENNNYLIASKGQEVVKFKVTEKLYYLIQKKYNNSDKKIKCHVVERDI